MKTANFKKLCGFTLVELIVVIAIIGILAAILVPSMMGYIRSSRFKTANSNAKAVYTAASTYCAEYASNSSDDKEEPANVKATVHSWNDGAEMKSIPDAVNKYLGADAAGTYFAVGVQGGLVQEAYWAQTLTTEYVGSYPVPNNDDVPRWDNIEECVSSEIGGDIDDQT